MVQNQISVKSNDDVATPKPSKTLKEKPNKRVKKIDSEIFAEMVEANKFLMAAIENKRDKTARYTYFFFEKKSFSFFFFFFFWGSLLYNKI